MHPAPVDSRAGLPPIRAKRIPQQLAPAAAVPIGATVGGPFGWEAIPTSLPPLPALPALPGRGSATAATRPA